MQRNYCLYDANYFRLYCAVFEEGQQPANSAIAPEINYIRPKYDPITQTWSEGLDQNYIDLVLQNALGERDSYLVSTNTDLLYWIYERVPIQETSLQYRKYATDTYKERILSILPNYVFPEPRDIPIIEFTWRYNATENLTSIVLPKEVDKPLREVIINGVEVFNPTYNPTTKLLQVNLNAGDRLKILF